MTRPIRIVALAPAHAHAALVLRQPPPGVLPKAYVYAPLDADLARFVGQVAGFNAHPDAPAGWELDVRAGPDFFARFLRELPGTVVVVAGRNKPKIDRVLAAVGGCASVLADTPWVIDFADFPKVERLLREADARDVIVSDMTPDRHDVVAGLVRELLRDPAVFGTPAPGTPDDPGLAVESTRYLLQTDGGEPVRRPAWWFDPREAGDGLADAGAALADLAMWLLFPDQPIDYRKDVKILDATRWPTGVSGAEVEAVTGVAGVPAGGFAYAGNGTACYALRGVFVRLTTLAEFAPPRPGLPDRLALTARGTRAAVAVEPDAAGDPELTVRPNTAADAPGVLAALRTRCAGWQTDLPGTTVTDSRGGIRIDVPARLRTTHEDHLSAVMREFVRQVQFPRSVPSWERANLLAKYYVTTKAAEIARAKAAGP